MSEQENRFRNNVCILVFNAHYELFIGERFGESGHWQLPQGGVEDGDTLQDAVVREVREELGVERSSLGAPIRLQATHSYIWDEVPTYAVGRWIGQSQTFWAVKFKGVDAEIVLDGGGVPEFQAWRWCALDHIAEVSAPKRRAGYMKALEEFKALVEKLRVKD